MLGTRMSLALGLSFACVTAVFGSPHSLAPKPAANAKPQPVMGCYFQSRSFHVIDGPCVPILTGFRVLFDSADAAIAAGYAPCDFCAVAFKPAYSEKVGVVQRAWQTYVKSVQGAQQMAAQRDCWADTAGAEGMDRAMEASSHAREAKTDFGAAGLALLSGQRSKAERLSADGHAEENAADEDESAAEAWFGEMARQEYLANYSRQYAIKAHDHYVGVVTTAAISQMEAERQALQRSVSLLSGRGELFDAAMTAGLSWMTAVASRNDEHIAEASAAMANATKAYAGDARLEDPAWVSRTLSTAWDLGTHGHPAYGLMASYLIMRRYPDNKRARSIYDEVCQAWNSR